MEEIRLLLLAERELDGIRNTIREVLSSCVLENETVAYADDTIELSLCIVTSAMQTDPEDFFCKQIVNIYWHFNLCSVESNDISRTALKQILSAHALVIISFVEYGQKSLTGSENHIVNELIETLLARFEGLLVSDYGENMYDKDHRAVLSCV